MAHRPEPRRRRLPAPRRVDETAAGDARGGHEAQRVRQRADRIGQDARVGIDEDEDVAPRVRRALVRTGRKAQVGAGVDHRDPREARPHGGDAAVARGVVDDDHLATPAGIVGEARHARREGLASVPVDDDDGFAHSVAF